VVIGGLITATALTLLVLPVLYAYFGGLKRGRSGPGPASGVRTPVDAQGS
jgi:cobalt-zinc-cadmium resistance protein CzcA